MMIIRKTLSLYPTHTIYNVIVFLILTLCLTSCSSTQNNTEQEIKELFQLVETQFEKHKGRKLKQHVSLNYRDDYKRTKKDIDAFISFYLLRHKEIHILSHIAEISPTPEQAYNVTLYAAMAGSSGKVKELLETLRTDVYKFTFTINKSEKEWELISAKWVPASPADIDDIIQSLE